MNEWIKKLQTSIYTFINILPSFFLSLSLETITDICMYVCKKYIGYRSTIPKKINNSNMWFALFAFNNANSAARELLLLLYYYWLLLPRPLLLLKIYTHIVVHLKCYFWNGASVRVHSILFFVMENNFLLPPPPQYKKLI